MRRSVPELAPHPVPQHLLTVGTFENLLQRVRAEFLEMPGLCLTEPQARKLWSLDAATCRAVLDRLLRDRFIVRRTGGRFARPS